MMGNATGCQSSRSPRRPARVGAGRRDWLPALTQFILDNQSMVYNLAYRILGDLDLAVTVTEDTFLRAFAALPQHRVKSPNLWLMRIAVAVCHEQLYRSPKLSLNTCNTLSGDDTRETIAAHAARQPSCDRVQAILSALPPDQRVTLVLSDVQGLSYREIAEVTGVSADVIRSRLSWGRTALRNALLAQGQFPAEAQP
jgi:RNA polymerase sigma factor (sigma-70 family)